MIQLWHLRLVGDEGGVEGALAQGYGSRGQVLSARGLVGYGGL